MSNQCIWSKNWHLGRIDFISGKYLINAVDNLNVSKFKKSQDVYILYNVVINAIDYMKSVLKTV